ncbi:hypothetical protein [Micromonospora rubida]
MVWAELWARRLGPWDATADSIAPTETRIRPTARTALPAVLHADPTAADVARLAATVGLTRQ